jgi:excisionase family DNA binding protein
MQAHAVNSVQSCKECLLTWRATMGINDGDKPMQEKMYTVQEVAQQLRVSERTVRNWVERGELRVFRIGKRGYRIPESDLLVFIEKKKQGE